MATAIGKSLRNLIATGAVIAALLGVGAVYTLVEGEDDGVRMVVTWDGGIKPDHLILTVAGRDQIVEPVPGNYRSGTWRGNFPYVTGGLYVVQAYVNYFRQGTSQTHNYTCSLYIQGVLIDSGYHDGVGSVRCSSAKT